MIRGENNSLACCQTPEAFIASRRRQPGAHAVGVLDSIYVLEKAQPCGLGDVIGVASCELEFRSNGPNKPCKLINQALPRLPVPSSGAPYQPCDLSRI
jgi:hypothetical protein